MRERATYSLSLRPSTPVAVGSVTLLPIERVVLSSDRGNPWVWISVTKEAYALIVRDSDGIRAVDTDAAVVSLEALREKVPGLDILLAAM